MGQEWGKELVRAMIKGCVPGMTYNTMRTGEEPDRGASRGAVLPAINGENVAPCEAGDKNDRENVCQLL